MMTSGEDLRRHPRVDIILKVAYPSSKAFLTDYSNNASFSGLFIATEKTFELGQEMSIELSFPGLLEPLSCDTVVRWIRKPEVADLENPPGVGVEFLFRDQEQAGKIKELLDRLARSGEPEAKEPSEPSPFRVLLVEDNPLIRQMLTFAVRKFHKKNVSSGRILELLEAENGRVACEMLADLHFDLAIVDYFMPVMDGANLLRWIRKHEKHSHLPVIMVSTGGEEVRREVEEAGADMFIDKPLMLNKLLATMQQLLEKG